MTKEHFKKFEFVSCELDALVKKINPDILSLTYNYSEYFPAEYVNIRFANGCTKTVNVTADSLLAIAKDVLKHI
ncbi:MAG: hypothetical protein ACI4YB_09930 [Oscillospiraceae bacterium]